MEDKKTFGGYVYKKRKDMGLTQKEFSEKLFVTESAVSKWERGVSYPDITLIRSICKILDVSEHELLTASEDVETRKLKKIAQKHNNMVKGYKNTMILLYSVSLIICFIINLANQHTLSWFFIVFASIMIATSLTLVPVLVTKEKELLTLGAFTISLSVLLMTCNIYTRGDWFVVAFVAVLLGITFFFLPLVLNNKRLGEYCSNKKALIYFIVETIMVFILLIVCNLYTGGGWFYKTALPITTFCMILPWGMMLIIRYLNINNFLKTAACLALVSAFYYSVNWFISFILENDLYNLGLGFNFTVWDEMTINGNINMIIFSILIILTIIFAVLGINLSVKVYSKKI